MGAGPYPALDFSGFCNRSERSDASPVGCIEQPVGKRGGMANYILAFSGIAVNQCTTKGVRNPRVPS